MSVVCRKFVIIQERCPQKSKVSCYVFYVVRNRYNADSAYFVIIVIRVVNS